VKTFPIKKKTNTELFIDGKQGLYKLKGKRDQIKKITDLCAESKTEMTGIENAGMKTRQPVWNDLHYMEGKAN